MDQKTWLWRKRSSEKTIVANDEAGLSLKGNEEEILPACTDQYFLYYTRMLHYEKEAALERTVKTLHEKIASLLCECNAKDNLVADHAKAAQEAIAGKETAEAEVAVRKQEVEEALQKKATANERLVHLNAALMDCRQQLSSAREGQDQRIPEAVMKTSEELEKEHKRLEEKFTETSKILASVKVENSQLRKALLMKERLIEDVSEQMSQATTEFNALLARLDSTEKENDIFKYEFRVLEKELEIRSEQQLESAKKISKLESECQRLRVLVRKRHAGPAGLAKMRSEVEPKGRNGMEMRRIKSNHIPDSRISFMIMRLCEVEEENKMLKESANKKDDELCSLRAAFSQISSELTLVEDKLVDKKCQKHEGNTNASQHKMIGVSDMSLMDDFVEMEKLAIISVDPNEHYLASTDKELFPVTKNDSIDMESTSGKSRSDWLQNVLKEILEQNHASRRTFNELLEEIRIALHYTDHFNPNHAEVSRPLPISGYITWKSAPNTSIEENEGLKYESNNVKTLHKDLEEKSLASTDQPLESEQNIGSLQAEVESLKESKKMVEDQIENQKLINEDLDTQLTISKVQLNEVLQKLCSLEVELEDRSHCCEELETTCLELQLQLQLESVSNKEVKKDDVEQDRQLLQTEITAASAKLAECQETIITLGRQLKALASPKETTVLDKVLSTTTSTTLSQQSSLLDHMLAEDGVPMEDLNSPRTKEIISTTETNKPSVLHSDSCNTLCEVKNVVPGALAIVPSKKRNKGGGLLRKLLFRRKRGNSKKKTISFAA